MLDWMNNPHAEFVLAAYAVAAVALAGIGAASLLRWRRRARQWRSLNKPEQP